MASSGYEKFDSPEGEEGDCCLSQYHPRKDPVEFISLISLISLSIGIVLTMIGYLVPREYEFDADMAADKMEEIEIYYDKLSWHLDVCIIVGMGFVVLGGILLAAIITYLHVTSDFWATLCGYGDPEMDMLVEQKAQRGSKHAPGYKSTSQEKPRTGSTTSS